MPLSLTTICDLVIVTNCGVDRYLGVLVRVFDCVVEQIGNDLGQPRSVAVHQYRLTGNTDVDTVAVLVGDRQS
jgi:hypothetical protein